MRRYLQRYRNQKMKEFYRTDFFSPFLHLLRRWYFLWYHWWGVASKDKDLEQNDDVVIDFNKDKEDILLSEPLVKKRSFVCFLMFLLNNNKIKIIFIFR